MRIHSLFALGGLALALTVSSATARAQDTTKPNPVKKAAASAHHTLKKAGNAIKDEAGEVTGATHRTLKKAGNDLKGEGARVTGDTAHIGGTVGDVAHKVSHAGKKAGHHVKHGVSRSAARAHHELKKSGEAAKDTIAKKTP